MKAKVARYINLRCVCRIFSNSILVNYRKNIPLSQKHVWYNCFFFPLKLTHTNIQEKILVEEQELNFEKSELSSFDKEVQYF